MHYNKVYYSRSFILDKDSTYTVALCVIVIVIGYVFNYNCTTTTKSLSDGWRLIDPNKGRK